MKTYRSKKKTLKRLWYYDEEFGVFIKFRNNKAGIKKIKKLLKGEK